MTKKADIEAFTTLFGSETLANIEHLSQHKLPPEKGEVDQKQVAEPQKAIDPSELIGHNDAATPPELLSERIDSLRANCNTKALVVSSIIGGDEWWR